MIKELLSKWVCKHEWVLYKTNKLVDYDLLDYKKYICKKCGKMKKVSL